MLKLGLTIFFTIFLLNPIQACDNINKSRIECPDQQNP